MKHGYTTTHPRWRNHQTSGLSRQTGSEEGKDTEVSRQGYGHGFLICGWNYPHRLFRTRKNDNWTILGPSSASTAFVKNVLVITNEQSWRIFTCVYPVFTFQHKCKNQRKVLFTLVLFSAAWMMPKIMLVWTRLNLLHDHLFVINPVGCTRSWHTLSGKKWPGMRAVTSLRLWHKGSDRRMSSCDV